MCSARFFPPFERNQSRADRASLAGIGMHDNVPRRGLWNGLKSTAFLRPRDFCGCRPAGYISAHLREIIQTAGINPDVQRKNRAQRGEDFLRLPALALLIDDVALQKDAASMESCGIACARNAPSAISLSGMPNLSATPCRKRAVTGGAL